MHAGQIQKPARRSRLDQLSWKLTLRYTLITVLGLLILEVLVLAGPVYLLFTSTIVPEMYTRVLLSEAGLALPRHFVGGEPNLVGLHGWMRDVQDKGLSLHENNQTIRVSPDDLDLERVQLLILDRERRQLAALGQAAPQTEPLALPTGEIAGLDMVLPPALAGEEKLEALYTQTDQNQMTVAAPIKDERGQVVGLVVLTAEMELDELPYEGLATFFAVSLMIFTIGSAIIGTIFGLFAARGLTRRLTHIAALATAWGGGDFSRTISDPSSDEIGQLAWQLNGMAAQLQELLQSRERLSVVEERNRLARELHDSVKQQVFAISMNLGAAQALWEQDQQRARSRLDAAFELARQSQQELTTIIQTLRPVALEGKGLQQALRDYVAEWQAQTCIEASSELDGAARLPLRVEEDLFRVAQEALSNVARHSQATHARIVLHSGPDLARLEVSDNGRGFEAEKVAPGVGLESMRERVEELGGTLTIRSGAAGTSVQARVPLAPSGGQP